MPYDLLCLCSIPENKQLAFAVIVAFATWDRWTYFCCDSCPIEWNARADRCPFLSYQPFAVDFRMNRGVVEARSNSSL
jgi:hypothetical protein